MPSRRRSANREAKRKPGWQGIRGAPQGGAGRGDRRSSKRDAATPRCCAPGSSTEAREESEKIRSNAPGARSRHRQARRRSRSSTISRASSRRAIASADRRAASSRTRTTRQLIEQGHRGDGAASAPTSRGRAPRPGNHEMAKIDDQTDRQSPGSTARALTRSGRDSRDLAVDRARRARRGGQDSMRPPRGARPSSSSSPLIDRR